ncbi:MAG TPA: MgtC/SapB family protein [Oculatellaceae cyanobacterium]|jgi:putative Mg2+ transporter-C (MgtC) family protein
MELSLNEAVLRLVLAFLLGSVVGMEREYTQQSAGLRTHILVCMGATVFTIVSASMITYDMFPQVQGSRYVGDPSRIAAQIVSGIGFIGGGAVLRHGASIRGLTTAASLWMMASIGMLIGIGHYQLSIIATLFSFLVLFIVGSLERNMFKKYLKKYTLLRIQVTVGEEHVSTLEHWVDKVFPQKAIEVKTQRNEQEQSITFTYVIDMRGLHADVRMLSQKLNELDGVQAAQVKVYHEEKSAS